MADSDLDFYQRRAREEQTAAEAETRPAVAAAHKLLMAIYAERIDELSRGQAAPSAFTWKAES